MNEGFPGNGEGQNNGEHLSEVELFNKAALAYQTGLNQLVRRLIGDQATENALREKKLLAGLLRKMADNPDLLGASLDQEYNASAEHPDIALFEKTEDDIESALEQAPGHYEHYGFKIKSAELAEGGSRISLGKPDSDNRYWQTITLESGSESIEITTKNMPISMPGDVFENIIPPDIPEVNTADVIGGVNRTVTIMQEWLALDDEQLRHQVNP